MHSFTVRMKLLLAAVTFFAWGVFARGPACVLASPSGVGASSLRAAAQEKEAPLSQEQALKMLQAGVPSRQIEEIARRDGIDFRVDAAEEGKLHQAGATESLIQLFKKLGSTVTPAQSAAPAGPDQSAGILQAARDALARKDYAEAVRQLKAFVDKRPGVPEAWFNLGYAYTGLHQPEEAIKAYQKTLELSPDLFPAQINLGILLMEQRQPQAALEHLQKAAALKPDHVRTHLYYARALAQTGQPDSAGKEYQVVIHLDPHSAVAPYELGQLELQQKHPTEALAAFNQALALDGTLAQADLGAALAAEALNDPGQAIAHLEKYLASKPDDVETRFHLAGLYLRQKQDERARDTLESIYRVKPDLPGLTAALGDVEARLKKLPEAEKYYRLAVTTRPDVVDLHRALGQVLLDEQKFPEAEGEFRTALKLDSHNRDAAIGLASSLDLQQRYSEAIPILGQLTKASDAPPYTFFVLATCYDHMQARKEALANYEHFLQISRGQNPDQEWQAAQRAKLLRREVSK